MITVFTPAYNRAYILPILYNSLEEQTCKDFEWLIVDDGSTDETRELITEFQKNSTFPIRYFYQENSGKHIAINLGSEKAKGHLFFIVDSDDYLAKNAISTLIEKYETIKDKNNVGGIAIGCRSIKNNGAIIYSKQLPQHEMLLDHNELVYKEGITGDFATAFKTDLQRQYPYPHVEDEKFFRESYVYRQIGKKYKTLYIDDPIYFADYLEDGLTSKSWQLLKKSPKGASLFFKELSKENIPTKAKIKALDSYWDFQLNNIKSSWIQKFRGVSFFLSLIVLFKRFFK
ncbi:glycosyltransferase family A protein [Soonwooa sp.]|uniref:glycosyltransferase family A protein n=1 Tax=Soonwooa sp. TaxID=1938592 RepID=UPI0028A6AE5B|nr:glycosyltransferase family A protein [Soonwooa sp.]